MQTENELKNGTKLKSPALLKWCLELYRDFFKIYMLTLLIGIVFALIIGVILLQIFGLPEDIDINNTLFGSGNIISSLKNIASLIPSYIILTSTFGSLFGISQEIYEKGDYSGTLKQVFINFKKNWLFYIVSGAISFFGFNLLGLIDFGIAYQEGDLLSISISFVLRNSLSFLWIILNCIYISCFLKEGTIINGFKLFFDIFRSRFLKIFKNFIQILGPVYLFSYLFLFVYGSFVGTWVTQLIYFLGIMGFLGFCLFVLFPLISLVSQITISQYCTLLETTVDENKIASESTPTKNM